MIDISLDPRRWTLGDAASLDLRRWALGDVVSGYALVGSVGADRRRVPSLSVGVPLPYLGVDLGAARSRVRGLFGGDGA